MTKKRLIGAALVLGLIVCLLAVHLHNLKTEKRMSDAPQEFLTWVQQAGTSRDFLPGHRAADWTYFYVPDQRSVYRIEDGSTVPELVCEDCDGDVQIVDNTLFFLRCGKSSRKGEWMAADLDGGNQQILNSKLIAGIEDWHRSVVGNFLLVQGYSKTEIVPLNARYAETVSLSIGEEQVEELLWTDGSTLYFSTELDNAEENKIELWRYRFDGEPEQVEIPDEYIYGNHAGNQVFFYHRDEKNVYCLSLPDETWSKLGYGNSIVYPMAGGEYLCLTGDTIERMDDLQNQNARVILQNSGHTYHDLLEVDENHLICWYTEYHSDYETCGCTDADYLHYYIRTELVDRSTGSVLWTTNGDNYILDT